jgi:hypothetical protein
MLPPAPGLSHSLPVDNYYIGVRHDWVLHKHEYWRTTRVGEGSEIWPLALTWDGKSYDADSLKTCVPIDPVQSQTEVTLIGGQRMAQTRRRGKLNEKADQPKAPRFSYRHGQITEPFVHSTFRPSRLGVR